MPDNRVILGEFIEQYDDNPNKIQIMEESTIRCDNCRLDLIGLIKIEESNKQQVFQTICPKCHDKTFRKNVTGTVYISPIDDHITILDVHTHMEGNKIVSILELGYAK